MQNLRSKGKWLTPNHKITEEMELWLKLKSVLPLMITVYLCSTKPASHDTYLALDRNSCDSSCLCLRRKNQNASLTLLGTTLPRMPAAGSFSLNFMHRVQSPPNVWPLFVCYLVFSQLWSPEQIASSSPGRENIPQCRISQIRNTRLLHPVKTDCGDLGLIRCKY